MRLNMVAGIVSTVMFIGFFLMIRYQTGIGDVQFLKSMIPHHGAAILMCELAPIQDPDIADLCGRIVAGQQAEIDEMKAKLNELKK